MKREPHKEGHPYLGIGRIRPRNEVKEMKTPLQEFIQIIKKRQEDDDVQPFMWHEHIIELAESLIDKEK